MPPSSSKNFFGIKVSKAGIPVNQASDKQLTYKDDFSTKTYYDNLNARMVEGLLPDGTYGLWVSKPGFDVTDPTAAINNNLVFNSNQDIFRINQSLVIPLQLPSSASPQYQQTKVPHGYNFTPAFQAFITIDSTIAGLIPGFAGNTPNPCSFYLVPASGALQAELYCVVTSDSTFIYFTVYCSFTGGPFNFSAKVYILQETAN